MSNAATPKLIGNYQIIEELGRGGMGVVYKAFEPALNRTVALKMLGESVAHQPGLVERFYREARAMAALNDPNVVQIHAVGEHAGQPYFVMEFVAGESLGDRLKRERIAIPEAKRILLQAAKGLHAAHEVGIVHRDIKPGNLMLTQKGLVKVTDFGIALGNEGSGERLTGTGGIVGTPGYLSPEACLGESLDARTDIFALGVVMYEMLTGRLPFDDKSPYALMAAVVQAQIPDVRTLNKDVDIGTMAILQKMLARRPADRYQTCADLAHALEQLERMPNANARPGQVPVPPPTPNPTAVGPAITATPLPGAPPVAPPAPYGHTPYPPSAQQPGYPPNAYPPNTYPPTHPPTHPPGPQAQQVPYGHTPYPPAATPAPGYYGQPAPGYPPHAPTQLPQYHQGPPTIIRPPASKGSGLAWVIGIGIIVAFIAVLALIPNTKNTDDEDTSSEQITTQDDDSSDTNDDDQSSNNSSPSYQPAEDTSQESQQTNNNEQPVLSGLQLNNEVLGTYDGKIGDKEFKLVLQKFDGDTLVGYDIAAGSKRPVSGQVTDTQEDIDSEGTTWKIYQVQLQEPGDGDYDGKFELELKHTETNIAGGGTWTGFKNNEILDIVIENYSSATE